MPYNLDTLIRSQRPARRESREAPREEHIHLKSAEEIAIMRQAGRIVAEAHAAMRDAVKPGISTASLDRIADEIIRDHRATPVFKGYPKPDSPNFPASITASINNELVHGIPSESRILKEGDIVSLDCGCTYQGFVGDSAFTWPVGEIKPAVRRLLDVTEQALYVGIDMCVLGKTTQDVATAVQQFVEKHGYSSAREYTGHGVGRQMHEDPQVPNWWPRGNKARQMKPVPLQVGMTFALEPMVIAGHPDLKEQADHWTVVTRDKSLCAHYEHTIAVTEGEPQILTLP